MKTFERELDIEQTKSDYRKVAWFYDQWSGLTESKAARAVIELADIRDGERIIEIACGTGVVFNEIAQRNQSGFNLGIDLSSDMLLKARTRLGQANLTNYELRQEDVFNFEMEPDSFDLLINNFMIDLMPEDKFGAIFSEFYRLLKPGGSAVVSVFSFGEKPVNKVWVWVARYLPKLLTNCRPVAIEGDLKKAGFEIERQLEVSQNSFPSRVYKIRKPMSA